MKIAICGFYGKDNFGDNLFQIKFSEILSKEYDITFYSDCQCQNISNYKNKSFLDNDIYIVGGGNVINSGFWFFEQKIIKPVFFLNVGVSHSILENKAFIQKLKNLNIIKAYVRDLESLNVLNKIQIQSEFLPDIGLTLDPINKTIEKLCIVNLNSYIFYDLFNNDNYNFLLCYKNLINIASFLDWLMVFDWKIKIIPLQTNKFFDDRVVNGMLFALLKNKTNSNIIYNSLTEDEIISEFSKADLIISTKYHSTVIAYCFNKKFIDISHHDKNLNFLKENNIIDNSVSFYDLTKEKLISSLIKIENEKKPLFNNSEFKNKWKMFKIQ